MNAIQLAGSDTSPELLSAIVKASETYSIVASQDIVDVRGLKLWAKGQPVSAALQQRLLERKLQTPLESCLAAETGVTPFTLHDQLADFLEDDSPLSKALRPWAGALVQELKRIPLHSVAQLLLTTALATRPDTFPHAVHAMALAGALAKTHRTSVDMRLAMIAGLLHDIGEVYIQPLYLDRSNALDVIGHKQLMVHPRVAQLLLDTSTDYPKAIGRAIGEHHERLDGSGYPARLRGDAVSPLGRLLAVVEVTLGILRDTQAPFTRAGFALRVVPGEFDPLWANPIFNMASDAHEVQAEIAASQDPASPLHTIGERIQTAFQLGSSLQEQEHDAPLAIIELAVERLARLRVAWNALGLWGAPAGPHTQAELSEMAMAQGELHVRLRELQRECMLLTERLGDAERQHLVPLWQDMFEPVAPA
jgi:HD domain